MLITNITCWSSSASLFSHISFANHRFDQRLLLDSVSIFPFSTPDDMLFIVGRWDSRVVELTIAWIIE